MKIAFKKLLYFISTSDRKRVVLILIMILIMAILDMIGVASILPFIAVLSNPDIIETNIFLNKIYLFSNNFGVENNQQLFSWSICIFTLSFFTIFQSSNYLFTSSLCTNNVNII